MSHRLAALVVKELRSLLRDKKSRMIVIMPVLVQVLIFPFAATLELENARIGIHAGDDGRHAVELTQRLAAAGSFSHVALLRDDAAVAEALDRQDILLAVRFSADFSRDVDSGRGAVVQVLLDGRRSNAAQIAANYIQSIAAAYQEELLSSQPGYPGLESELVFRNWYNPNLNYKWFVLPSLIALITTIGVLIVTALSVAREREQGTLDQLLVSPLATWQIFLGKAVPAQIIATAQGSAVLMAAMFCYRIPFSGSLALFYATMLLYGFSLIGVGLLISALCSTQQQAFIGVFLFMMPAILLSGYISPVENMPVWLQNLTMINPVRHFTEITKQIYLKGADFSVIRQSVWPLLAITGGSIAAAYALFRRTVGY
jgi:ABC-2 type transport system permease protein